MGELQTLRSRGQLPDSDADQLAGVTHVPGIAWVGFFGLVNLGALALGGYSARPTFAHLRTHDRTAPRVCLW